MKRYSIFPAGDRFRLHTPEHEVIECATFHQAVRLADTLRRATHRWWWSEWFTYKPMLGRSRWVRNAIVTPKCN